jgi:hypothetical protein
LAELAENEGVQAQLREELHSASTCPTDEKQLMDNALLKHVVNRKP